MSVKPVITARKSIQELKKYISFIGWCTSFSSCNINASSVVDGLLENIRPLGHITPLVIWF